MTRGTFPARYCQWPHPCDEPLPTHASTGDPPPLASSFVCALDGWSFCFPWSYGSLIIKSHWPSRPDSLGILNPLSDPQAGKPYMGLRTFTTVRELLWYYFSPVFGLPTWWVWNLILLWLCYSSHLTVASSLSWTWGIFFFRGFQHPSVIGY